MKKIVQGPMRVALRDITEEIKSVYGKLPVGNNDLWVVSARTLLSKKVRKLNAELGIHLVNKNGSSMSRKRNK
jgi:hypothetical protein